MADFDERSGIVSCKTPWGLWFQTLDEISLEIDVDKNLKSREIEVKCQHTDLTVTIRGEKLMHVCCVTHLSISTTHL